MSKYKNISSLTICWLFLFQTIVPDVIFAGPAREINTALDVQRVNFAASVPDNDRKLIRAYLSYMSKGLSLYPGLVQQQFKFNSLLGEFDSLWRDAEGQLSSNGEDVKKIRSIIRYVIDKGIPLERQLTGAINPIEKKFAEYLDILADKGVTEDGIMESARQLRSYYDLLDNFYEMKGAMILAACELTTGLVVRLEKTGDPGKALLAGKMRQMISEVSRQADLITQETARIESAKNTYESAVKDFDQGVKEDLKVEVVRTASLSRALKNSISYLKKNGDINSMRHADLISRIDKALNQGIDNMTDPDEVDLLLPSENFLFIEKDDSRSGSSDDIFHQYTEITRKLTENTAARVRLLEPLSTSLSSIEKAFERQKQKLQAIDLANRSIWPEDEWKNFYSAQLKLHENISSMQESLGEAERLAGEIDFSNVHSILSDRIKSAKVIRINQALEELLSSASKLKHLKTTSDFAGAALVAQVKLKGKPGESAQDIQSLLDINDAFTQDIALLINKLQKLVRSLEKDRPLFDTLQLLCKKILKEAGAEIDATVEALKNIDPGNPDSPYFKAVTGAIEVLQGRRDTVSSFEYLLSDQSLFLAQHPDLGCAGCIPAISAWHSGTKLGNGLKDVMGQLGKLRSIRQNLVRKPADLYSESCFYFDLADKLDIFPTLLLHEDSIDVSFQFGHQAIYLTGIGDISLLNLTDNVSLHLDIHSISYVGGWGFRSAWNNITSGVRSIGSGLQSIGKGVVSVGKGIGKVAAGVVSTAYTASKKIYTTVGPVVEKITDPIRGGIDWGFKAVANSRLGKWAGKTTAGKWIGETVKEAFYDGNGKISLIKVGGYALGGAACVMTGGAACVALGIGALGDIAKGGINLTSLPPVWKDRLKFGVSLATFIGGGINNLKSASANLSKWGKITTFLGLSNPGKDFKDAGKSLSTIRKILGNTNTSKWTKLVHIYRSMQYQGGIENLNSLYNHLKRLDSTFNDKGLFGLYGDWKGIGVSSGGQTGNAPGVTTGGPGGAGSGSSPSGGSGNQGQGGGSSGGGSSSGGSGGSGASGGFATGTGGATGSGQGGTGSIGAASGGSASGGSGGQATSPGSGTASGSVTGQGSGTGASGPSASGSGGGSGGSGAGSGIPGRSGTTGSGTGGASGTGGSSSGSGGSGSTGVSGGATGGGSGSGSTGTPLGGGSGSGTGGQSSGGTGITGVALPATPNTPAPPATPIPHKFTPPQTPPPPVTPPPEISPPPKTPPPPQTPPPKVPSRGLAW